MAVAALIISIVAVVVAALAAWFTKRQADHAKQLVAYDTERRHEERTPQLTLRAVPTSERRGWPSMEIENRGPHDLDDVVLSLLRSPAGEDPVGLLIDTRNGDRTDTLTIGALPLEQPAVVRVELEPEEVRGEFARFLVECRAGEERWRLREDCLFQRIGRPRG